MKLNIVGVSATAPGHAPAGTKCLSNLLRSQNWQADLIATYLWEQAVQQVAALVAASLLIWDDSVLEKAESDHTGDLCSVRSSKAKRLTRIRKGFFQPPTGRRPICVAGLHWIGSLVSGLSGTPSVALMQWWTRRGPHAMHHKVMAGQLLARCRRQWGRQVRDAWQIARGKRSWSTRDLYDVRSGRRVKVKASQLWPAARGRRCRLHHNCRPIWSGGGPITTSSGPMSRYGRRWRSRANGVASASPNAIGSGPRPWPPG